MFFYPQALCATGLLTITPVGLMDSPTPPSMCHVRGICRGTIKVRDTPYVAVMLMQSNLKYPAEKDSCP